MSQADPAGGETPAETRLQEEIERTRAELGDTVEALVARVDMKARAHDAAAAAGRQLRAVAGVAAEEAREQLLEAASSATGAAARAGRKILGRGDAAVARAGSTVLPATRRVPVTGWLYAGAAAIVLLLVLRRRRR